MHKRLIVFRELGKFNHRQSTLIVSLSALQYIFSRQYLYHAPTVGYLMAQCYMLRKRDSTLTCYDMQNYKSRTAALGVGLCFGPPGRARPGEVNRRLATATRAAGAARRGPRLPTREPLALAPLGPGPGGASVTAGERAAAPRRRAPEGPESPARHLKVGYL